SLSLSLSLIGESWLSAAIRIVQKVLNIGQPHHHQNIVGEKPIFNEPKIIDIMRVQVPVYFEFITRVAYHVSLSNEACRARYCDDNQTIGWFSLHDLAARMLSADYLGPEPAIFGLSPSSFSSEAAVPVCREITILD